MTVSREVIVDPSVSFGGVLTEAAVRACQAW